jgi:hypothetical protein
MIFHKPCGGKSFGDTELYPYLCKKKEEMEKMKVNKLECRFPALFKVMWWATVVWVVVSVSNYFGHWLLPEKLDGFGAGILFMFAISSAICFNACCLDMVALWNNR